jgi:hypothetical protein
MAAALPTRDPGLSMQADSRLGSSGPTVAGTSDQNRSPPERQKGGFFGVEYGTRC